MRKGVIIHKLGHGISSHSLHRSNSQLSYHQRFEKTPLWGVPFQMFGGINPHSGLHLQQVTSYRFETSTPTVCGSTSLRNLHWYKCVTGIYVCEKLHNRHLRIFIHRDNRCIYDICV